MIILSRSSLRSKITAVLVLTSTVTLLLATAALFTLEVAQFKDSIEREMRSVASAVGANSEAALEFDDAQSAASTLDAFSNDPRVIFAALYKADGSLFASYLSSRSTAPARVLREQLAEQPAQADISVLIPIEHQGRTIGSLYLRASTADVYQRLYRHLGISVVILLICLIGSSLLSARLGELISRPITALAETARRVSVENDYSIRATQLSNDETGILVAQFNNMLEEISRKNKELEYSERQLRLITDSLPVLIAYIDANERYQFNNYAYERWFGHSKDWFIGKTVREIVGPEMYTRFSPYIKRVLSGESLTFEAQSEYPVAGMRSIGCTLVPDRTSDDRIRGYFTLIADITEQKNIEAELRLLNEVLEQRVRERTQELENSQERLRQSERLASIGTLAAGVAHEIRNPLNSILLATQFALRYRSKMGKEIGDIFVTIASEAKRCATIIRNILVFAKSEKTEKSPQDVNQVVRHAADLSRSYLNPAKADIRLELTEGQLPAILNSTEIEQVIINLINNAAESKPDPVQITLKTEAANGNARIKVSDTGPGIPDEILRHIFDPFFSTKRQKGNTGLGLSLSHGIISDHDGNLSVESTLGKGTTFCIDLPRASA